MDPRMFGNFADQFVRTFRAEREPQPRVYRRRAAPRRSQGTIYVPTSRRTGETSL